MKVSREQAAENRSRIVDVAGQLFREKGFDGIGVADLMKAAGLTHGGFYGHFKSKSDLAAECCERAAERSLERWADLADKARGDPLAAIVTYYLSERHRDAPGTGCVFSALGGDVARQDRSIRRTFADGLGALIERMTMLAQGRTRAARRKTALATMSEMVGAMVLARAVDDPDFSREILAAAASDLTARR
jgi:TetR/AcrR family transcriptional repressor of nem operon